MKKNLLIVFHIFMSCTQAIASQMKTKSENEPIIFVSIKKMRSDKSMLTFAYTDVNTGYRIHESLTKNSIPELHYFTVSSFLKGQAGITRKMGTLNPAHEINIPIKNLLFKAMSAAQTSALGKYDNVWSHWQYKNGAIQFMHSKSIPNQTSALNAYEHTESNDMRDSDSTSTDSHQNESDLDSINDNV